MTLPSPNSRNSDALARLVATRPGYMALSRQLQCVHKVQRQHSGPLVVACYEKGADVPQFPYLGHEHCLAHITYKPAGQTRTTAIVLHDGRLQTLENNIPLHLSEIQALSGLTLHPSGFEGVGQDIDLQEHQETSGRPVAT